MPSALKLKGDTSKKYAVVPIERQSKLSTQSRKKKSSSSTKLKDEAGLQEAESSSAVAVKESSTGSSTKRAESTLEDEMDDGKTAAERRFEAVQRKRVRSFSLLASCRIPLITVRRWQRRLPKKPNGATRIALPNSTRSWKLCRSISKCSQYCPLHALLIRIDCSDIPKVLNTWLILPTRADLFYRSAQARDSSICYGLVRYLSGQSYRYFGRACSFDCVS